MSAVTVGMWWVMYLDGKPRALVQGPDKEKVVERVRMGLIGTKFESLDVISIIDAPIDDVLRCGFIGMQSLLNNVAPTVGWWVGYFNDMPAFLIASSHDADTTLANLRSAMLGTVKGVEMRLAVKPYNDAPIEDVIRASIMGILTTMGAAIAVGAARKH